MSARECIKRLKTSLFRCRKRTLFCQTSISKACACSLLLYAWDGRQQNRVKSDEPIVQGGESGLMELRTISIADLSLYESIHCDPNMMAELGGAFPRERIPQILRNALGLVETGRGWVFKNFAGRNLIDDKIG